MGGTTVSYQVDPKAAKEAFSKHRSEWSTCEKCDLCKHRLTVVQGNGPVPCNIAIVGGRPGRKENAQGLPFVGESGDYLDKILKAARLPRNEVFITNVLGCRPGAEVTISPGMVTACMQRLYLEIQFVSPVVILAFGQYAAATLFGKPKLTLKDVAGVLTPVTIQGQHTPYQVSAIATYPPEYLLRLQEEGKDEYRDLARETFRHVCMAIDIANEFDRLKERRKT